MTEEPALHNSHYDIRVMPLEQSQDPREAFQAATRLLAAALREHPTVPADPSNPEAPLQDVFNDEIAVLLSAQALRL